MTSDRQTYRQTERLREWFLVLHFAVVEFLGIPNLIGQRGGGSRFQGTCWANIHPLLLFYSPRNIFYPGKYSYGAVAIAHLRRKIVLKGLEQSFLPLSQHFMLLTQ